jgi:hypothetical protein
LLGSVSLDWIRSCWLAGAHEGGGHFGKHGGWCKVASFIKICLDYLANQ